MSSLPSLPVELLRLIVQQVDATVDLHSLALSSRVLNFLALEELCSRHHVDLSNRTIILNRTSLPILSSLASSLVLRGSTLNSIDCDLTTGIYLQKEMFGQTLSLANLVDMLSEVRSVSLYFVKYGPKAWEDVLLSMLDTLLRDKKCTSIYIKTLARSITNSCRPPVDSLPKPIKSKKSLLPFLSRFRLPSPKSKRKINKAMPDIAQLERNHLQSCFLQTFPPFIQTFFLETLNASILTTLTFKYIYNVFEWEHFLSLLHLPFLRSLTISHCIVPDSESFSLFFKRHPTLTFLDFHHNTYTYPNPPRLSLGIFPRLTTLRTSPTYLAKYFPTMDNFPELKKVVILAGDVVRISSKAALALGTLKSCMNDIALCITFSYVACLDQWLLYNVHTPAWNSEGLGSEEVQAAESTNELACVKMLRLESTLIAHSSDAVVDLLVRWLCMFPELREIAITRSCLPRVFPREQFEEFVERIRKGSRSIQKICVEVDGERWISAQKV